VAVTELPELGHYPQLEDPGAIAAAITAGAGRGSGRA
jgi:pimeloyl-ACP methyl ester carboxylesterase